MKLEELRKSSSYCFDCYYSQKQTTKELKKNDGNCDIWGFAELVVRNKGVEYNFCIDNSTNEQIDNSAIYRMHYNEEGDYWDTDYDNFVSYKIDFNNKNWKKQLEDAMCKALIELP